ncbi:MAG: FkbM family methyltransferase [Flavobacteriales bacterium]
MSEFERRLKDHISSHLYRRYGKENYDELRFGPYKLNPESLTDRLKRAVKQTISYKSGERADALTAQIRNHIPKLERLYLRLNPKGQSLLIQVISYRLLGGERVMLPTNNPEFHNAVKSAGQMKIGDESIDPDFLHFTLYKYDLKPFGSDIQLFFGDLGIAIDFILEQYAYKEGNQRIVEAKEGDVILDVGGCYGDTALYFAEKTGPKGHVYSFEFIPKNLKILQTNLSLNPELSPRISVVDNPVSDISDQTVYFQDRGPASRVSTSPFDRQTGTTTSIRIDDFCERNGVSRVDYIKMDIEGSEPAALRGAEKVIRRDRPKLAIAIYHGWDDFANIPEWISNLGLDYTFYLGHYTIHAEETILFAKPLS